MTKDKSMERKTAMSRPTVVCLCGSTRFYAAFQQANYEETMAGRIVLSVGFYPHCSEHGEEVGCSDAQKESLDALHMRKIDLADEILVLNVGGYVGQSTQNELEYARATGKRIRWLEEPLCSGCIHSANDMRMVPRCFHMMTHAGGSPDGSILSQADDARDHCGPGKLSWDSRDAARQRRETE